MTETVRYAKRTQTINARQVTMDPGEEVEITGGSKMFVPNGWWVVENEHTGHIDSMPEHQFDQVYRRCPTSQEEAAEIAIEMATQAIQAHLSLYHPERTARFLGRDIPVTREGNQDGEVQEGREGNEDSRPALG